ncbi:MAG: sugar phosphate isomerase [Deltaproteobacteria bacterium SG8_13]|nr:MAG: sugar phosphate isomerase [Deltaproteobacteria bacterium SG8_13]
MRYGAMNHPARPVLDELAEIAGLGFDYLELTLDPPEAHHSQVRKMAAKLRAELRRRQMGLVCHMPTFVSLADLTDSIRRASVGEVLASLEAAAELQPAHVVLHPAHIAGMGPYVMDMARQHALDSLAAIADRAGELGLVVCLENMFPRTLFCVEPDDFQLVFEQFPALQLTLDIGHGCIGSPRGNRVLQFIQRFAKRVGHLHVSDNFGKRDDHLPLGTGSIPFAAILKELKKTGFSRTVTFEVFTDDRQQLLHSKGTFETQWARF